MSLPSLKLASARSERYELRVTNAPQATTARDLILGTISGYTYYQISRFVGTLGQSGSDAHVCLFSGPGISAWTKRRLRRAGFEVVDYDEVFPFIRDPHPLAPKSLPDPIYIFNYRHFLYYDYLLKHEGEFRNVLLTDVKDVVFQGDPFGFEIGDAIHVAMESREIPVGQCSCTPEWILAGYDRRTLDRMRSKELSCAGTTIAPAGQMMRYLRLMLGEVQAMKDAYVCADQAAHNVLLHDGKLEPVVRLYNFEGPILTVGTEPRYQLNGEGWMVNRDGSVIPIVHQYDRHAELIELFEARVRPSRVGRALAAGAFWIASRARPRVSRLASIVRSITPRRRRAVS